MTKPTLLLVEDDPQQSDTIKAGILRRFPMLDVQVVETEQDFYTRIDKMEPPLPLPCLIICDCQLPWAYPSPNPPSRPGDVRKGTFREAGLRCWRKFREHRHLNAIHWIFYSVLEETKFKDQTQADAHTTYVEKSGTLEPLLEAIQPHLSGPEPANRSSGPSHPAPTPPT